MLYYTGKFSLRWFGNLSPWCYMDSFSLLISAIVNNPDLSTADRTVQIKEMLLQVTDDAGHLGIIERLVAALRVAGFQYVSEKLTTANCPTATFPSLEGAQLDSIVGSRKHVLAELRRIGRRPATMAEGLFFALVHSEELSPASQIRCFDQIALLNEVRRTLVLRVYGDMLWVDLDYISSGVPVGDRVLSFPMTEAELAARDAEDAQRSSV